MRQGYTRAAAVLVVFVSYALAYTRGQESTPADSPGTLKARAHAIREAVIEAYGTPNIVSAYHASQHAVEQPAASPAQPAKIKKGTSDIIAKVQSRIDSQMDESDLFVISFSQAMYFGLEQPKGTSSKALAPARSVARSFLFSLFDYVASSLPYSEVAIQSAAAAAADLAAKKLEFDRNSRRGAMHMAEVKALADIVLSEDDRKQYEKGDLMVKASLLFKAAHETLEKQELPNAYVLWMVEGRGADGIKSHMAREQLSSFIDPANQKYQVATWDSLPELEKWNVATDSLKLFTERGENALASPGSDPQMSSLIAGSLSGAEGDSVLKAVGPDEYAKWKSASDLEKKRIAAGAAGIEAGMNFIMPMLIGDNRVPTHTNQLSK